MTAPITMNEFSLSAGRQAFVWWLGQSKKNRHAWMCLNVGMRLAQQIRAIRADRKLTRRKLAALSGVSTMTIWRLEVFYGACLSVRISSLIRIAAACDCAIFVRLTDWLEILNKFRDEPIVPKAWDEEFGPNRA